jgi:hypothetical protein
MSTLVLGISNTSRNRELLKRDFVAEGGHQPEPEGQYEKNVHVLVPPARVPQGTVTSSLALSSAVRERYIFQRAGYRAA